MLGSSRYAVLVALQALWKAIKRFTFCVTKCRKVIVNSIFFIFTLLN